MSNPPPLSQESVRPADSRTGDSDWQRSLRGAIRTLGELFEALELEPHAIDGFEPAANEFPLLVPRSFVARMRKGDPRDPLLAQILPVLRERLDVPGFSRDPLDENGLARQGVLRKYAGRALLIATAACPVHCRYCFRRHFPYADQLAAKDRWAPALMELRRFPDVKEIILSGGDPLSLANRRLAELLQEIEKLRQVDTLRIHTRFPIILPERVDRALLQLLSETRLSVVLVTHSNHANELDGSVRAALRSLAGSGTRLLNQSVLLRGINDDADRLEALSRALFECGVLPYYLHLLDPVAGAAHFDVALARGREVVAELRHRLPGYLVPRLVCEKPGELSKTIIA